VVGFNQFGSKSKFDEFFGAGENVSAIRHGRRFQKELTL